MGSHTYDRFIRKTRCSLLDQIEKIPQQKKSWNANLLYDAVVPNTCKGRVFATTGPHDVTGQRLPKPICKCLSGNAFKVLDAPNISDDFYTNTIDCSEEEKLLIALGSHIYFYDPTAKVRVHHVGTAHDSVPSVRWLSQRALSNDGSITSLVELDGTTKMTWSTSRVNSLCTFSNTVFLAGGTGRTVSMLETRSPKRLMSLDRHGGSICQIVAKHETYIATGANDNLCCIWDIRRPRKPVHTIHTEAAVKGLLWAPEQNLLIGSGCLDKRIRCVNTVSGAVLSSVQTDGQVTGLCWSRDQKTLFSSHGYGNYGLARWSYPGLEYVESNSTFSGRVLHLCKSDNSVIAASSDETLRFFTAGGKLQPQPPKSWTRVIR